MKNISNPFANKGRIITGKHFIGRSDGLETLANTVTESDMPNNLAIIGYPRIGKSSLANQAVIQKEECLIEKNNIAVWVNFSGFSNREAFFKRLVGYSFENLMKYQKVYDEINTKVSKILENGDKDWDDLIFDVEKYFETLRSRNFCTIFVLDEFDEARKKFENNPEAFSVLRSLGYDPGRFGIAFVTTSRRSIRKIEIQSKVSSTLDGIFGKVYLGMYAEEELGEYYRLYDDIGLQLDDIRKQQIGYYCGGHPYLLASLGFEIVEAFKVNKEIDIDFIFQKTQLQFSDYYEQLIALLREDNTFAALLQILFGPKLTVKPTDIDELLTYGLIRKGEKYFEAFSRHFQNYLKFKEREEHIEAGTWHLISRAEKGLRQLVLQIFSEQFGDNWEDAYPNRYDKIPDKQKRLNEILLRLKEALQRDLQQYGNLAMNLTVLDQTYIHQLFDYFILFSWEDIFHTIFQKEKSYWNEAKKLLERVRNPYAHQKPELLKEWEIRKAEDYCREILSITEKV